MQSRLSAFKDYNRLFGEGGTSDIDKIQSSLRGSLSDWDAISEKYGKYKNAEAYTKEKNKLTELYSMNSEQLKGKKGVAYTTADGYNIKWEDLYNDARVTETTQHIQDNYDVGKHGTYKKKDVKYESASILSPEYKVASDEDAHLYNLVNGDEDAMNYEELYNVHMANTNDDTKYRYVTDEERGIFNTLWEQQGAEKAKEYLDLISSDLRQRKIEFQRQQTEAMAKESPVGASVASVIANLGNNVMALPYMAIDYADNGSIDPDDPLYTNRRMVQTTRSTVENDVIDGDVGQFFYRHGMNIADNLASRAVSLGIGTGAASQFIMSSGAFVDTTLDAKERGLSDVQALSLGAISGAAEWYFESKGFEAWTDKKTLTRGAWEYFAKNLKTELVGELFTEGTNDVADFFIAQDLSKLNTEFKSYIASGESEKDAFLKVVKGVASRYADVAAGTILSTGVMAGPSATIGGIQQHSYNKAMGQTIKANERVGDLFDIASNPEVASAYEVYTKYANKGINADNISDAKLGRLYSNAKLDAQEVLDSKKSTVEQREAAQKAIDNLEVYAQFNPSARTGSASNLNNKILKGFETDDINALIESGLESAEGTEAHTLAMELKTKVDSGKKPTTTEIAKLMDANDRAIRAEESNHIATQLVERGESEEVANIVARKMRGETLTTEEAEKVLTSEVALSVIAENSNSENVTEEVLETAKTMDKKNGALFVALYDGKTDIDAYTNAFNLAVTKAEKNFGINELMAHKSVLSNEQISKIYGEVRIKVDHNKRVEFQKLSERTANLKAYKGVIDDSVIDYENTSAEGKVNWNDLSPEKKQEITFAKGLAQATGMNLVFITDGKAQSINGSMSIDSNTITIDIYAEGRINLNELIDAFIPTMSHELTHWMENKSPVLFRKICDIVFPTLEKADGLSEGERITREINKALAKEYKKNYEKENPGKTISLDKALELVPDDVRKEAYNDNHRIEVARSEIVARACEDMLSRSKVGREMFNSLTKDEQKTLTDKIKDIIQNIKDWISNALGLYESTSYEAQMLKRFDEEVDKISALWDEILTESVKVNQALEKSGAFGHENTADSDALHSIREEYANEIEAWKKDGMPKGETFILGTTGDVLQGLGAIESDIYMLGDKIKDILNTHPEMTIEEIKKIPQILENPVLILKSKNVGRNTKQNTRMVIFGNVKAQDGRPILTALDLRPNENHFVVNDMQKVTSAYTKDVKPIDFVRNSLVVYADKKRTTKLLRTIGFKMPIELQQSGYIGSISYVGQNVNIKGEEFSKVFKEDNELHSDRDSDTITKINTSMTMDEAKQMIQRAFVIGGIYEWYDGEYKNGDDWLRGEGANEVALNIENEYTLTEKYLNKLQGYIDGDFYVEDILEAYLKGTLVGKEKPKAQRLDTSKEYRINDKRFYSPQRIKDVKKILQVATQRVTEKNRKEVSNARAKVLLFAHNKGASELLGMTQAELNKKLRAWSNYSAKARDISKRFNNGVADSNKWTGIENCSWLYKGTVTTKDLESLVKSVKGASSDYEKLYIARTMLALDTHIDWSWLSFEFDTYNEVNKGKTFSVSKCLGYYTNESRKIVVTHDKPHTVAHEMGHALDYQWARDLGYNSTALTEVSRHTERITDAETKQFFENFRIFIDSLTDNGDISSEYTQNPKEVFARFVARFVQWVENTGTGRNSYNIETSYYNDKFTASHYIEFVKLLQEKAMLDAKKMETATNEDIRYSEKDSEGKTLSEGQIEFFRDSKVRDAEGNLLVVYHGTYEDFTVFDISKTASANVFGKGHYFTNKKTDAQNNYASSDGADVHTKIEALAWNYFEEMGYTEADYESNDAVEEWNSAYDKAEEFYKNGKVHQGYLNIKNPVYAQGNELYDANGNFVSARSAEYLKELGYDGIIDYGVSERFGHFQELDADTVHYVVFDSNQFKPTSNTNPTSNPDFRYSERDDTTVYDLMGETERIVKENEKFKAEIERLKERLRIERQVTHGNYFNENQLGAVAGHLRNISKSNIDKVQLMSSLKDVYSFIAHSENLVWEDVFEKCYRIAESMIAEAKPLTIVDDYSKALLKEIRGTRISLDDEQKQEAKNRFGKNWHNHFMGKVIISNDAVNIDTKWQEWSSMYPDVFDAEINSNDMISELYDIIDSLKTSSEVIDAYSMEEQKRWLANEIYNQYWNVSPILTTADRYEKKIKQLNFEHRNAMKDLRENYMSRLRGKHKNVIKKLRERKDEEIALAKQHGREMLSKHKENAERKTRIQSITANSLSLNEMLVKNSKDKHIPEIMREPVTALLQAIDFSSKQLLGMKGTKKGARGIPTQKDISLSKSLSKVKDMMVKATNAHDELVELYGHGLDEKIEKMMDSVDDIIRTVGDNEYVLNKMALTDLQTLDTMVKTIKHAVNKLNKFHTVHHSNGIANLSQESILYLNSLGKGKIYDGFRGKSNKLLNWGNALPYYVFKRYGIGGMKIYEALQDGWDKFAFNTKAIIDYANDAYTSKNVKEWSEEIKTFRILIPANESELDNKNYKPQYQEVQLTVPQIMSMYCLNKREQARGHLFKGGIRVADFKDKEGKIVSQSEGVIFTEKDIRTILNSLTEEQRNVADKLQEFMNTVCADWGNAVSMARFGYKAFGEENYFPIQSDKNNLAVNDETEQPNSLFKLLNMSFTKSTIENANNRIVISDIFDVFAQHTSDMAKYNALALPVLDAFKWYNYTEKQDIAEGTFKTMGVKQSIERAFGKDGQNYFTTFLKDINGQQEVSRDTLGNGFFKNAKIAAVGANLRVVLLQPTSYVRASAVIENKYLTKALVHTPKIKKAEKYCGIALWKSMGYYDTNIQRGLEAQIKHADTWKDKATEWSMKGAEIADKVTWGYLWNACEIEVRDKRTDLKVGSQEFYDAIAKRLREVIYATQVVDSTMTRSQMMRSSDGRDKLLTAFASEPTLSYNMIQDAYMEYSLDARRMGKKEAVRKHSKRIGRIIFAYTMTNAVAALVESAFDALRDDDDEEMDVAAFMKLYFSNFANDMSITAKIPFIKEFHSVIQGFSISRTDAQWMEEMTKAITTWYKIFNGKGNAKTAIKYSIKAISDLSGLPIYNVYRDAMAALNKLDLFTEEELNEMCEDFFLYGILGEYE